MTEDMDRTMSSSSSTSVCRAFFNKFSTTGTCRNHGELVSFIMKHASSREKIEDWIRSVETSEQLQPYEPSDAGSIRIHRQEHLKSDEKSRIERECGNEAFKRKNLADSLHRYNQAIKLASFPTALDERLERKSQKNIGSCLSLAFANRSAVLVELGESYYDNALMDIESAFKYGYPKKFKGKLLLRKANICIHQRRHQQALECINEIRKLQAEESESNPIISSITTSFEDKIHELEMQIDQLKMYNKDTKKKLNMENKSIECEIKFSENSCFENASDKITLEALNGEDRHVIAVEELNKGDLLFKEEPFASVLLSDFYNSHCHHCHKLLPDSGGYFFPCKRCSQVKFCDNKCMDAANVYHQHECMWLDLMHSVGIAHLAMRIVLVAGINNILKCARGHSTYSNIKNVSIFEKTETEFSYLRVYSLLDHVNDMHMEDLFHYSLTAALLTRFLISKTSFFKDSSVDDQILVGGTILRHICQQICNAHAITAVLEEYGIKKGVVDESQERIATAIFPAASMMNHSCNPNINFQFKNGKTLMVKASRSIERGSEVYNCYGPHFRRLSVTERQETLLQQYFFSCTCTECTREITSGCSFADQFSAYRCTNCESPVIHSENSDPPPAVSSINCPKCGTPLIMKLVLDSLNTISNLLEKGQYLMESRHDWNHAITILKSCHIAASKTLYKLHHSLGKICDCLAQCYVMIENFEEASTYLRQSLEYVENRFGKDSVEFARELVKFQEVHLQTKENIS